MTYAESYMMVALFFVVGLALPVIALSVGRLLRPDNPTTAKGFTYESGIDPVGGGWVQYNVRYYLFALLFVLFDVETVFLYPWAVAYDTLRNEIGLFVLVEMLIFVILLVIGLVYAWKKKVLEWK